MNSKKRWFLSRQIQVRPLASFAVAFLIGIIAAFYGSLPHAYCMAACILVLLAYLLIKINGRRVTAILMLFALLAGPARMSCTLDAMLRFETQYSVNITGRIVSELYTNPDTGRVISRFQLESVDGTDSNLCVRLYLRGDAEALKSVAYGQRLSTVAHIWVSDPVTNPYEFDFWLYLQRSGMPAYATAKIEDVSILDTHRDLQSIIIEVRQVISERIDALFPENAALVRALILGDRTLLSEEMREALNETGTAHLICISGLHVTVLAMMISALLSRILSRNRATILTLLILSLYGMLIGFSSSFVRALIMFAIFRFAPIAGYPSDAVTRLCAAMLFMLMVKPMNILDNGFVLSFTASAGIILLTPPLTNLLGLKEFLKVKPTGNFLKSSLRKIAVYFPNLLCATLAAQLATLPAVVAYFGIQSVISVPCNLICVPLCMFGYLLALAALLLSVLSMPLGICVAMGAERLFTALIAITHWSAALPFTGIRIGRYPPLLVLLHGALILASSELSRLKSCLRRFIPLTLIAVAALSSLFTYRLSCGFSLVFLDAGQADCAIVRTQGHTYMVDVGDTYTPAGDYLSATCLHLDGIFLSHPHQDHAGGLEDVLTVMRPEVIYVPAGWFEQTDISQAVTDGMEMAQSMGIEIVELSIGDELALSQDTKMTVYAPDAAALPDEINDLSMLLSISHQNQSVLFTGDLSMEGEPDEIPDTDILKVAHHGSAKGTSPRFLASSTPSIAIIPVGDNNFGHPSPDTLSQLEAAGARVLRTDQCGAITLTLGADGDWNIETYFPTEEHHELE